MRGKTYSFVRTHRRRCRLTQKQLAALVDITEVSVSRLERSKRSPSTAVLLACSIVFGLSVPELFPSLHTKIEERIRAAAKTLLRDLAHRTDADSREVCSVLEDLIQRITNRDQSQKA